MKDLLLLRKGKFILYIIACMLPIIDTLLMNLSFALIVGSIEKGQLDYFIKLLILSLSFSIFGALLFVISRFMRIRFMRDTILDIRTKAFDKIFKYSYRDFNKKSKDVYISNLINDINIFEQNFFLKLINVIYSSGYYVVSLIILAVINLRFAINIFIISIIVFLLSKTFQKRTIKLQEDISENNEKFTSNISNILGGLEILKLNSVEDKFLDNSLKTIDNVERKKLHYTIFIEGQSSFINFLSLLIYIGILIYAMNNVLSGFSLTRMILIVQLSNSCIWPIIQISPLINELKASSKIYTKIAQNEEGTEENEKEGKKFEFNTQIEVKNLKFSYEEKEVFKEASFKIEKGKKYLLKGASGSGKSTLIKLLSMIIDGYEGVIEVDSVNLKEIREESLNNNISFIYQDVFIFEDTIYNNITLFKDVTEEKVLEACKNAGLIDFIEEKELGLNDILLENGKNLSEGQRQRISIARALVKDVDLLFVDEATSSLNEELGRIIEDALLSLDSTVIAISHRYYEGITEKYDYILEINDGLIKQHNSQNYFNREVFAI